jgi:hypothetical protein
MSHNKDHSINAGQSGYQNKYNPPTGAALNNGGTGQSNVPQQPYTNNTNKNPNNYPYQMLNQFEQQQQ